MNAKELAQQFSEFRQKALDTANTYNRLAKDRANKLSKELQCDGAGFGTDKGKLYGRIRSTLGINVRSSDAPYDTLGEFDETSFTCSYEYNDACHCHPEYRTWEHSFPTEWIDLEGEELNKAINADLDQKWAKFQQELDAEAKKQAEETEKKRQEAEWKERETFAKLKVKYEG